MATGETELSGHAQRLTLTLDWTHRQLPGEIAKPAIWIKARA